MARLKFNGIAIGNARGFATTAKSTTGTVADGIATIQRCMQSEVASRNNIAYRLTSIQTSVSQVESDIQAIYQTVDNATANYNNAERQIVVLAQQIANGYRPNNYSSNRGAFANSRKNITSTKVEVVTNTTGTKWGEVLVDKSGSLFKKLVGKVGFLGGMTKAGADFISAVRSDSKVKMGTSLIAGGKSFTTLLGELASNAYKKPQEQDWKKAFIGDWSTHSLLENLSKTSTMVDKVKTFGGKWWASIKKEKLSYSFKNAKNVGDKVKVGTKWTGVALSALSNGIENYDDYKKGEMDKGRFVAETIGETVADVAVGAVVTATVVGTAAALGVAAPAVVVGVAAAGVTWALDGIVKATMGKDDTSELLSDLVLDTGKLVLESGKDLVVDGINTVKGIGKAISNVGNAIGNIGVKWSACFG